MKTKGWSKKWSPSRLLVCFKEGWRRTVKTVSNEERNKSMNFVSKLSIAFHTHAVTAPFEATHTPSMNVGSCPDYPLPGHCLQLLWGRAQGRSQPSQETSLFSVSCVFPGANPNYSKRPTDDKVVFKCWAGGPCPIRCLNNLGTNLQTKIGERKRKTENLPVQQKTKTEKLSKKIYNKLQPQPKQGLLSAKTFLQ